MSFCLFLYWNDDRQQMWLFADIAACSDNLKRSVLHWMKYDFISKAMCISPQNTCINMQGRHFTKKTFHHCPVTVAWIVSTKPLKFAFPTLSTSVIWWTADFALFWSYHTPDCRLRRPGWIWRAKCLSRGRTASPHQKTTARLKQAFHGHALLPTGLGSGKSKGQKRGCFGLKAEHVREWYPLQRELSEARSTHAEKKHTHHQANLMFNLDL